VGGLLLFQRNARNGSHPQAFVWGTWTWESRFAHDKKKSRKRPMANNPRDNSQNPQDRKDKASVDDPKRDRINDGGRDQQQAEQDKQGQQGDQTDHPQTQHPDNKHDARKPQQRWNSIAAASAARLNDKPRTKGPGLVFCG
jgi:hypothetical protein